jgi:hypothetical protein
MLAKIGTGVLALVALLAIVIATRPASFRVERSATIEAPAVVVFAHLNDLHRWSAWNPFETADPTIQVTYEGAPEGVGASYHYTSEQAGEGRMTLVESIPGERVAVRAEFIKPFAATNDIEFTITPNAEGVSLTWTMSGDNNFIGKAISLFIDMDEMLGAEFEKGLVDLKRLSEEEAARRQAIAPEAAASLTLTAG